MHMHTHMHTHVHVCVCHISACAIYRQFEDVFSSFSIRKADFYFSHFLCLGWNTYGGL